MAKAPPKGGVANNTGGGPNKTFPQKPIPGPERTGGPVSLQKALKKKSMPGKGI